MATTTTNFGWDIPQSTDLVKDGATAIAALGQDIDTALIDLKGGTTGQILAKASGADLDYSWITNDVGDITEVTAGTGISGGGTSGAVTVTNSMATAIDAKGDLIGGTGADTFARLAVGANDTVLTADSTATTGLKWAAVASTTGPAFSAYRNGNQSVTNNVWTKIQMQSEVFDTDSCYDNATNYRFTPTKAGKYQVSFQVFNGGTAPFGGIYKNGVEVYRTQQSVNATGSVLIDMSGTTDYLEFYGLVGSSSILEGGDLYTFAMATWIRS